MGRQLGPGEHMGNGDSHSPTVVREEEEEKQEEEQEEEQEEQEDKEKGRRSTGKGGAG